MATQVFPIVPASASVYLILIPILLIVLIGGTVATYAAYSSRHVKFVVSSDGITIRGDMFGRFVPKDKMVLKSARAVDLAQDETLKPKWRMGGTGYPGYKSGWYRLADQSKALVFITDPHHVVYVPTVDGSGLMISVANPEEFLATLKQ
jgi:acetyl-CoA carboxylase carboxyltransferase component